MQRRVRIPVGETAVIEYDDDAELVQVGDRLLPPAIEVNIRGAINEPTLWMRFAIVRGVPECVSLRLDAQDDGRGLRTMDIRGVTVDDWVEQFYSLTALRIEEGPFGPVGISVRPWGPRSWMTDSPEAARDVRATEKVIQRSRAVSRRKIGPELLAEVARIYREHIDDRPVEAVRAAYGCAYRTAAGYVQAARDHGDLPPTTRGKVTG